MAETGEVTWKEKQFEFEERDRVLTPEGLLQGIQYNHRCRALHKSSQLPNSWACVAAVNSEAGMSFCDVSAQKDNMLWTSHRQ